MDTRRGAHAQYGWISLLYLREDYRGRGFGIQLLARRCAVMRICSAMPCAFWCPRIMNVR